ncbi:unnamed protein product [Rotaria magnacalcarata]
MVQILIEQAENSTELILIELQENVINIFSVELIIDIQILFILSSSFNTLYKIVHNGTRRCEYVLLSFIETTFIMVIQLRYFAAWDTYYMASLAMN